MFEFEKKLILNKSEYNAILELYNFKDDPIIQTNYYYDTPDGQFTQTGITCRIREKNGEYVATLKDHNLQWTNCSVEYSAKAKNEHDDHAFGGMNISLQGSLKTIRYVWPFCSGVTIMLDKNEYLNTVDYELEIEYELCYEDIAIREYNRIIDHLLCAGIGQSKYDYKNRRALPKSKRFFEQKKKGKINEFSFRRNSENKKRKRTKNRFK